MNATVATLQVQIMDAVAAMPGASTRELAKLVGTSEWTADYHLRRMARSGAVSSETMGRRRLWYTSSCGLCPVLKRAVPTMRRPEAIAVALALDESPVTMTALAARSGVEVGQARWVAHTLDEAFLLERSRLGRVSLRRGAETCVAKATGGQRCALWGKCAVSREWVAEQRAATSSP